MPLLLKKAWHQVQVGLCHRTKLEQKTIHWFGGGVLYLGSFFRKYPNHVQKRLQRKWVPFYPFTKPHQSPQTEVKWKKLRKGHGRLLKHIHLITRDFLYPETSTDFTFQTHFVRHWDNSGFPTEALFIPTQNNPPPKKCAFFQAQKPIATGRSFGT